MIIPQTLFSSKSLKNVLSDNKGRRSDGFLPSRGSFSAAAVNFFFFFFCLVRPVVVSWLVLSGGLP